MALGIDRTIFLKVVKILKDDKIQNLKYNRNVCLKT